MTVAGELREVLAWEQRIDADDGYGNTRAEFVEMFRCAARQRPLRGSEAVIASRLAGRQPYLLTVRVSSLTKQITTEWRVRNVRSGAVMNVRSVANTDEKRAFFDLVAEEGVAT